MAKSEHADAGPPREDGHYDGPLCPAGICSSLPPSRPALTIRLHAQQHKFGCLRQLTLYGPPAH